MTQRKVTLLETQPMTTAFMEEKTYASIGRTRRGKFIVFLSPIGAYPTPCTGLFKYTFDNEDHAWQMFNRLVYHAGVCPPRPRGRAKSAQTSTG